MTLILVCLTPDHVIQVSDRRLTFPDGRVADDNTTKAVLWNWHTAWAYTGLAFVGTPEESTAAWLTNVLAKQPAIQAGVKALAAEATSAFGWFRKRQAFVGVGWGDEESSGEMRAVLWVVSNFHGDSGVIPPRATFTDRMLLHPGTLRVEIDAIPDRLTAAERKSLLRQIRVSLERGTGPATIARLMVEQVREVARRDKTVGKGVLVTCLPKTMVLATEGAVWASQPTRTEATFMSLPRDEWSGVVWPPNVAIATDNMQVAIIDSELPPNVRASVIAWELPEGAD
jgi:hypothetical protein